MPPFTFQGRLCSGGLLFSRRGLCVRGLLFRGSAVFRALLALVLLFGSASAWGAACPAGTYAIESVSVSMNNQQVAAAIRAHAEQTLVGRSFNGIHDSRGEIKESFAKGLVDEAFANFVLPKELTTNWKADGIYRDYRNLSVTSVTVIGTLVIEAADGSGSAGADFRLYWSADACGEPEPVCGLVPGQSFAMSGPGTTAPESICEGFCRLDIYGHSLAIEMPGAAGGGSWWGSYRYNGQTCSNPTPTTEYTNEGQVYPTVCATMPDGREVCVNREPPLPMPEAATVNGNPVPDNRCEFYELDSNGYFVCGGTPPADGQPLDSEGNPLPVGGSANVGGYPIVTGDAPPGSGTGTPGTPPGGGDGGTPGGGDGGTPGGGDGGTPGGGDGDGGDECPEGESCEGSGGASPLGDLYTPTDKTVSSIMTDFANRARQTELVSGITRLFTVQTSAACEPWVLPPVWVFPSIELPGPCNPPLSNIWGFVSSVVIATSMFFAFQIAVKQ